MAPCLLADAGLDYVVCDNNRTPDYTFDDFIRFTLSPVGLQEGETYGVTVDHGEVYPAIAVSGGPVDFFLRGAGDVEEITLTLTDRNHTDCSITISLTNPGACSDPCNIFQVLASEDFTGQCPGVAPAGGIQIHAIDRTYIDPDRQEEVVECWKLAYRPDARADSVIISWKSAAGGDTLQAAIIRFGYGGSELTHLDYFWQSFRDGRREAGPVFIRKRLQRNSQCQVNGEYRDTVVCPPHAGANCEEALFNNLTDPTELKAVDSWSYAYLRCGDDWVHLLAGFQTGWDYNDNDYFFYLNDQQNVDSITMDHNGSVRRRIQFPVFDEHLNPFAGFNRYTGFPFFKGPESWSANNPLQVISLRLRDGTTDRETIFYHYVYDSEGWTRTGTNGERLRVSFAPR